MFYLRLYGARHTVKDSSDSERTPAVATRTTLSVYQGKDRIAHTTAFVTPVMEHWLEQEIAQWFHHEASIRRSIAP